VTALSMYHTGDICITITNKASGAFDTVQALSSVLKVPEVGAMNCLRLLLMIF
jgi:hypothetical protein